MEKLITVLTFLLKMVAMLLITLMTTGVFMMVLLQYLMPFYRMRKIILINLIVPKA